MSTQRHVLTLDTVTPQAMVPQTGADTYLAPVTLNDATGDEIAFKIDYTVNKLTTGNATGLVINLTTIAAPNNTDLLSLNADGATVFACSERGHVSLGVPEDIRFYPAYNQIFFGVNTTSTGDGDIIYLPNTSGKALMFGQQTANTSVSGNPRLLSVEPVYNQASGTAANTDFLINRTETLLGSGEQLLCDMQVGGVSKFKVNNAGSVGFTGTSGAGAAAGTLANAPSIGDPAVYIPVTFNGVVHYIPAWT
ncbi:MAG TPA: hypothetical protein ENI67_04695 [Gammaproteobacteria bacterium]|nr:hypothetical protein [Gammaproteobacteria bacterium]